MPHALFLRSNLCSALSFGARPPFVCPQPSAFHMCDPYTRIMFSSSSLRCLPSLLPSFMTSRCIYQLPPSPITWSHHFRSPSAPPTPTTSRPAINDRLAAMVLSCLQAGLVQPDGSAAYTALRPCFVDSSCKRAVHLVI